MKLFLMMMLTVFAFPIVLEASLVNKNDEVHLRTWEAFDKAATAKTSEIKAILFGPILRVLGMLGVAYGVVMLIMGQTKQMMTFGGIGLLLNIIPYFIEGVFSAILPRL